MDAPPGTTDVFTKTIMIVPMAKLKAGTVPLWHSLSEDNVKNIVDDVFVPMICSGFFRKTSTNSTKTKL